MYRHFMKKLENWIYLHIYIYMQEANKLEQDKIQTD